MRPFLLELRQEIFGRILAPLEELSRPPRAPLLSAPQCQEKIVPLSRVPPTITHSVAACRSIPERDRLREAHPQVRIRPVYRLVPQERPAEPHEPPRRIPPDISIHYRKYSGKVKKEMVVFYMLISYCVWIAITS